jgi:hypothetical protein
MEPYYSRQSVYLYPVLAVLLTAGWQAVTVHVNYHGNRTALFYTGSRAPLPPELAAEHVYVFPNSTGYDGQFYHLIAHDPVFRRGFDKYIDAPQLRYRRILVPFLAFAMAGGRSRFIDRTYVLVCWLFVGLGTYWACRFAHAQHRSPGLGLLFCVLPGVVVSIDRLVVDVALAALTVGFALHVSRAPGWKLYLILIAAALARETGFFLVAATCLSLAFRRQWKPAAIFASAAVPALSWYAFVSARTEPVPVTTVLSLPLRPALEAALHPTVYPPGLPVPWLVHGADMLALAGMLVALILTVAWAAEKEKQPLQIALVLFAVLCVFLDAPGLWGHVFSYGRVYTPWLLLLALHALESGRVLSALPLACVVPRTAIEFGTQVVPIIQRALAL